MGSDVRDFFEDTTDIIAAPFVAPTEAAIHAGEGAIDIAKGDVGEGVKKIASAPGETYQGLTQPYVEVLEQVGLGDVARTAQKYGPMVVSLYAGSTGNFWSAGAAGAPAGADAGMDLGAFGTDAGTSDMAQSLVTEGGGSGASLAEGTAGVRTGGEEFLLGEGTSPALGDAGSMTLEGGAQAPGVGDAGAFDQWGARASGEPYADIIGSSGPAPASKGIISGAMDWAKQNPLLGLGALSVGAGVVSGAGTYLAQKDLQEDRLHADRELQAQKVEDAKALEEWKRRFAQSGSYFDARIPIKPRPGAVLKRPDGSPVYSGGVISTTMR
jgi:hypothetical protein